MFAVVWRSFSSLVVSHKKLNNNKSNHVICEAVLTGVF